MYELLVHAVDWTVLVLFYVGFLIPHGLSSSNHLTCASLQG